MVNALSTSPRQVNIKREKRLQLGLGVFCQNYDISQAAKVSDYPDVACARIKEIGG